MDSKSSYFSIERKYIPSLKHFRRYFPFASLFLSFLFLSPILLPHLLLSHDLTSTTSSTLLSFSEGSLFPQIFRTLSLIILEIWFFAFNAHILTAFSMEPSFMLEIRKEEQNALSIKNLYALASTALMLFSFFLFLYNVSITLHLESPLIIPSLLYFIILMAMIVPEYFFPKKSVFVIQRRLFLRACLRIFLAPFFPVYFSDIVLADIFTSFSRVFGDLESSFCLIFNRSAFNQRGISSPACLHMYFVPVVISLPYLWRFFQCLRQYVDENRESRHLKNALKYSTAFPVILFAILARTPIWNLEPQFLFKCWIIASLVNSLYSFYWDLVYDWDVGNFRSKNFFLRDQLVFKSRALYYFVILLNLCLRMLWSLRIFFPLDSMNSMYIFQVLEIFRRFIWIFFRVEHQYLRNSKKTIV